MIKGKKYRLEDKVDNIQTEKYTTLINTSEFISHESIPMMYFSFIIIYELIFDRSIPKNLFLTDKHKFTHIYFSEINSLNLLLIIFQWAQDFLAIDTSVMAVRTGWIAF